MRDQSFKNNINLFVTIESIKLNVVESEHDLSLIEEGFKLPPTVFYPLKSKHIS